VLMSHCNADIYQELLNKRMSMEDRCVEACGIRYCHELKPGVYPTPIYEIFFFIIRLRTDVFMAKADQNNRHVVFYLYGL